MSAHRGIFPFHDVGPQRDIPLSWCQPTEGYSPFMMTAHKGISPFHDVSPQRDIHLLWCQPTEEYSTLMMSANRGIFPFHDVGRQRDIPLSWCQPTEGYSPFMMTAHKGISPFHDVSPQRAIPLSWCQLTEGYPPFMMSAPARSKGHGRWPSWIHSFCVHLLHPSPLTPLYPLCVTWLVAGWQNGDREKYWWQDADRKMRMGNKLRVTEYR